MEYGSPKPEISVAVAVYNVPESYLRQCIESIERQTVENVEILLVDDGSTDHSGGICEEYAAKDRRIRVIHQSNQGLAAARNTGVDNCTADWITYVDGDDWVEPDLCEKALSIVGRHADAQVVLWGYYKDFQSKSTPVGFFKTDERVFCDGDCELLQGSGTAVAWAKLYNVAFLNARKLRHNAALPTVGEDVEFNYRLFSVVKKAVYVNFYLNHYRYNEFSTARAYDERFGSYCDEIIDEIDKYAESNRENPGLRQTAYDISNGMLMGVAVNYVFHPDNRKPLRMKLREYGGFTRHPSYREGLKHIRYQKYPTRLRVPLLFTRVGFTFGVYLVAAVRHFQIRVYNRAA